MFLLSRPLTNLLFTTSLVAAVTACSEAAPAGRDPAAVHAAVHAAVTHRSPPAHAGAAPPAGVIVPEGMVYVPGGVTHVGSAEGGADEEPVFVAQVRPFLLDRGPVSVARFRRFVDATSHVTDAERLGDAAVLDPDTGRWQLVAGATWRQPLGPTGPAADDAHPVTQVSWNDAAAYARWAGRRLPSEVEWEHAARGAVDSQDRYAWGNSLVMNGRPMANTGEITAAAGSAIMGAGAGSGASPGSHLIGTAQHPSAEDGYLLTAPVGAFPPTRLGLVDMGGNIWEWTASWYRPYDEVAASRPFAPTMGSERVQRGGSFLCSTDFCHGYRVSARSHSTPETALFHTGFRTAADVHVALPVGKSSGE